MYRKPILILASLGLVMAAATAALGQVTGGRVTGTVLDAQGAAVANATVNLRHIHTGHSLTTQTTSSGSYHFPNVPVGDHTLTTESTGFQPVTHELKVVLNQESTLDVMLQIGELLESVDVSAANEALVQTDSSQLGHSFGRRQVRDLPVFGNQNALALLSASVVEQSAGVPGAGGAVGGTRPRGNSFNIDGVDNNDPSITGPSTRVILDAVEEFSLLNNNFNAEFGTGAGGQFNTITKSGTNEFHGAAFLYWQNQHLNAASTLLEEQLRSGQLTRKPSFRDARFGGTFGGPLVENKLFFFGAYQRERITQASTLVKYAAPTPEGLQAIAALNGASPFVVNLLRENLTLAPNQCGRPECARTVLGAANIPFGDVVLNTPAGSIEDLAQINIDHLPSMTDQFRYRFSFGRSRAEQPGGGNIKFNNLAAYDTRLFSATWVRTINSSLVNDLRLSYRRVNENYPLADAAAADFPNISLSSLNLNLGPRDVLPQGSPVNNNYQIYDALSVIRGPHTFKFGGEYRRLIYSTTFVQLSRGYYDYAALDQLLRDEIPSTQMRGVGSGAFAGNQSKFYAFAQDDLKLTPALTLNLGLRYEYSTLPRDLASQALNAAASVPGVIDFDVPQTDRNNFAPRLGVAYAPGLRSGFGRFLFGARGQSAIRANFGMAYYEQFLNLMLTSLPPQFQQLRDITTSAAALGFDTNRPFLQNGGIPNQLIPIRTPAAARAATQAFVPDQVTPSSTSWTLSFQRELTPSLALEVRYLGTRGHHLPVQLRLNAGLADESNLLIPTFLTQPAVTQLAGLPALGSASAPAPGTIRARPGVSVRPLGSYGFTKDLTSYQSIGSSQYDAGSISLMRRFSRGVAFTGAYTFSKTIDDATTELNSSAVNPRRPQNHFDLSAERSLSALDIPHRFAASVNYDLPFFAASRHGLVRNVLGGWQVNAIFQAQSGQPVTVLSGRDSNMNFDSVGDRTIINLDGAVGTSTAVRAINAAGQTVASGNAATVAYVALNPNAQYIQAGPGARANAGRNTLRTNGFSRTDAVFIKNFQFGEDGYNLQFGTEVSNLFNQRIRTVAGVGAMTAAFATAGNQFFNNYGIGDFGGRTIQLRAKFIF